MQYDHAKYPMIVGAKYVNESKQFSGKLESVELLTLINDARIIIDGGELTHRLNYSQFTKYWRLENDICGTSTVRKPENVGERMLESSRYCMKMIESVAAKKNAEDELTIALSSEIKKMRATYKGKTDSQEHVVNVLKGYINARFDILEKYIEENYVKIDRKH